MGDFGFWLFGLERLSALGFDALGFDALGFDALGFDALGLDALGLDALGLKWFGLKWLGFDALGLKWLGFRRLRRRRPQGSGLYELAFGERRFDRLFFLKLLKLLQLLWFLLPRRARGWGMGGRGCCLSGRSHDGSRGEDEAAVLERLAKQTLYLLEARRASARLRADGEALTSRPAAEDLENFAPAFIDELVDLGLPVLSHPADARADSLCDLRPPGLELPSPAPEIEIGLVSDVLLEQVDLEALDPVGEDGHPVLPDVEEEEGEEVGGEEEG